MCWAYDFLFNLMPTKKSGINEFYDKLKEDIVFRFFVDDYKDIFAHYENMGHYEIKNIKSSDFLRFISTKYYLLMGETTSLDTLKNSIDFLPAIYGQDPSCLPIYDLETRVAERDGKIYYDLSDKDWTICEIDENGHRLTKQSVPIFRRNAGQNAQLSPTDDNCFEEIFKFVNIHADDQLLFAVSLVSYFMPSIAHPILMFSGKPGVSKTTSHSIIKSLVDPTIVMYQKIPKDDKDLLLQWRNQWVLFYDNVSTITSDISDTFCRGVTGEGSSVRKLYTDVDEIYCNLRRCFLLNGIDQPGTKPDLMQRTVLLELQPIKDEDRKTEESIFKSFNELKPKLLGSIFNIISRSMKIKESVKLSKLPRMADFAVWGEAISQAMGYPVNTFVNQLIERQDKQEKETAEFDPLYTAFVTLLEQEEFGGSLEGSSTFVLDKLKDKVSFDQKKYLPHSPGSFGKKINRMKEIYASNGLLIEQAIIKGRNYYQIRLQTGKYDSF
jgi:hypothetical protein